MDIRLWNRQIWSQKNKIKDCGIGKYIPGKRDKKKCGIDKFGHWRMWNRTNSFLEKVIKDCGIDKFVM